MAAAACGPSSQFAPTCPPDVSDTLDVLQGVERIATRDYARGLYNDHINFVAMDTQSGNRVLLTLYLHKEADQLLGISKSGKTLFIANGFILNKYQLCTVTITSETIYLAGSLQMAKNNMDDTLTNAFLPASCPNYQLIVMEVPKCHNYQFSNTDKELVAKADDIFNNPTVTFLKPLSPAEKILILVYNIRRQLAYYKFLEKCMTPVFINMPPSYVPTVLFRHCPTIPVSRCDMNTLVPPDATYFVRISHHHIESGTFYLDVLDGSKLILLNVKLYSEANGVVFKAVDAGSRLYFTATGIHEENALEVKDATDTVLAYRIKDGIYNDNNYPIAGIQDPTMRSETAFTTGLITSLIDNRVHSSCKDCHHRGAQTRINLNADLGLRMFTLAWSIWNCFTVYKFHHAPIPYIQEI